MRRLEALNALYDEIFERYGSRDPELVRRRLVPEVLESRVVLVGQAPGRDTQRLSGLPYCFPPPERPTLSRGGRELDAFLANFGYTIVPGNDRQYAYHTDLAHYFPGRKTRGTGDVKPAADEVALSRRRLEAELSLVRPAVVVALGQQPAAVLLERYARRRFKRLSEIVATPIACRFADFDAPIIAVHHPSGAFQHPSSRTAYAEAADHVRKILRSEELRAAVNRRAR